MCARRGMLRDALLLCSARASTMYSKTPNGVPNPPTLEGHTNRGD